MRLLEFEASHHRFAAQDMCGYSQKRPDIAIWIRPLT